MSEQLQAATPLMRQYFNIKNEYSDALVFFQVGDFYELFFNDAVIGSSFLGITLTKRGKHNGMDIPLCGIPCHMLMHHLSKLVRGGFKVAVGSQTSKPQPGTIVTREVTRLYSPGTLTEDFLLDQKKPSYVLSLGRDKTFLGLVFAEVLTSELFATQLAFSTPKVIENELMRFEPDEVVMPIFVGYKDFLSYFKAIGLFASVVSPKEFGAKFGASVVDSLQSHQAVKNSLETLGDYLSGHNSEVVARAHAINFYDSSSFLSMDSNTVKTLEILRNNVDGSRKNTLLSVLDNCATSAGSRTLVKWLSRPLVEVEKIHCRQDMISTLVNSPTALFALSQNFKEMPDLERIVGRIVLGKTKVADFLSLIRALELLPKVASVLQVLSTPMASAIVEKLDPLKDLLQLLKRAFDADLCNDESPIKPGFDAELDRLKNLVLNTQSLICSLEEAEIQKTGIETLKIRYSEGSGYSIEITKSHLAKVPENYVHLQTLVGKTRFYTQELKTLEQEVLSAQERIEDYQEEVFQKVKNTVFCSCSALKKNASALAILDALFGLAWTAYTRRYNRPEVGTGFDLEIIAGRHPVVEENVTFVPNDLHLTEQDPIWLITGPNMGGKSTFLRQSAQICLMAQIGSFVPAKSAKLPIIDKIFTRIGSGDNLAQGKSTFLVEMEEVANICARSTQDSLLILDEVGRGTGTYDGISIAQALLEFIRDSVGAKCLFATHYQELCVLEEQGKLKNYHTTVSRQGDELVFLHKIEPGVSGGSFGIDVARLAGLPESLIVRASEILKNYK